MATVCVMISCSDGKKGFRRTADQITGRYSSENWWEKKKLLEFFTTQQCKAQKALLAALVLHSLSPSLSPSLSLPLSPSLRRVPFLFLFLSFWYSGTGERAIKLYKNRPRPKRESTWMVERKISFGFAARPVKRPQGWLGSSLVWKAFFLSFCSRFISSGGSFIGGPVWYVHTHTHTHAHCREKFCSRNRCPRALFFTFLESVDDTLVLATNEKEPFCSFLFSTTVFSVWRGGKERKRERERSCIIQVRFWKVESDKKACAGNAREKKFCVYRPWSFIN